MNKKIIIFLLISLSSFLYTIALSYFLLSKTNRKNYNLLLSFVFFIYSLFVFIFALFDFYFLIFFTIQMVSLFILHFLINNHSRLFFEEQFFLELKESDNTEEEFLIELLDFVAREKPYLNPFLTPIDLAKMMNVSVSFLTKVINKYLDKSFYEFINSYRIDESKNKLIELINNKEIFDFLSLYSEFGFASKADFSKVFKTYTGITPSQYKIRMLTLKNRNSYFTVGVFVDSFYDTYEVSILSGIQQFAINNGIRLFYFDGGAIDAPVYAGTRKNYIYEFANSHHIDGIIMMSSSLCSYHINEIEFENFCNKFKDKFIVSIGKEIKQGSSILVDNKQGMKELLTHLIENHNYRKIVFVKGPENNFEANERFLAYKEILEKYEIPFNENYVIPGMFLRESGKKAVSIILDERNLDFEAIVAPNDIVAMQIIQELAFRGIRVPEDKAVVGFDDIKDAINFLKPLTTVHQPLFDIGYKSIRTLFEMMCGHNINQKVILPTKIVVRESCGCKCITTNENKLRKIIKGNKKIENFDGLKDALIQDLSDLLYEQFANIIDNKLLLEWSQDLVESIINDINEIKEENFLSTLSEILSGSINNREDAYFWNFIIIHIFNSINNINSPKRQTFINELKKKAKFIIDEIKERKMGYPILETRAMEFDFFMLTQSLTSCFDFKTLSDIIYKNFPEMGIKSIYIFLFDNKDAKYSKLIISYENKSNIMFYEDSTFFLTKDILPGGLKNLSNDHPFVIAILSFYNELIGYVIYEFENKDMEIFELLNIQLSNTIKGILEHCNNKQETKKILCPKYKKSRLPDYIAQKYYNKLIEVLENKKLYKKMDLSLPELANIVGIPRNHLSYIINEYAKTSFHDLINHYRIEEAKRLLINSKNDINILDIAFEAGFNSKSTFNYVFKKYTGKTPSEFKEKNSN
ncbi:MAG: helix-turn-helix domain-containing protein [Brevinematia bacterium]